LYTLCIVYTCKCIVFLVLCSVVVFCLRSVSCATGGAGTAYPSGASEFTSGF